MLFAFIQVTTGFEMAQSAVPEKLTMLSYLTQVHELFRGEIPCVKQPKRVSRHHLINKSNWTLVDLI